jgi:hypothetical protein
MFLFEHALYILCEFMHCNMITTIKQTKFLLKNESLEIIELYILKYIYLMKFKQFLLYNV